MSWRTGKFAPTRRGCTARAFRRAVLSSLFAGGAVWLSPACAADPAPVAAAPKPAQAARPEPKFDIDAYDVDGNTLLDDTAVETAVYPYLGPARGRADVAAARNALEKAYRSLGYATVVVEVPQQDARTGVVKLHVVEVPVGRLRVVGSQYNLPSRIKEQVPAFAEGKVPNFTEAQAQIAEANNRLPDRQITPLEKVGKTPGTVDVDLKVKDSLPISARAEVNNDHGQNTSQLRTIATASYGDLWQLGHTITATAILAPQNLKDTEVFSGSYSAPIWNTPWTFIASGYTSNSNVSALSGTGVIGKGYTVNLRGALQLPPLGQFGESFNFGIDYKHAFQSIVLGKASTDAVIDYLPLYAGYTVSEANKSSSASATASVTLGLRGLGSDETQFFNNRADAAPNFVHFNIDLSYTRELFADTQLVSHLTGQVSDQPLLANEQFSAGGLASLRGYLQSEALGDDGISASFDIKSPSIAPFMEPLTGSGIIDDWRFYIFSDSAVAWVLDRLPEQRSLYSLSSMGFGSRLELFSHFSGNVLMGMPMRDGTVTKAWHPDIQFSASTEF